MLSILVDLIGVGIGLRLGLSLTLNLNQTPVRMRQDVISEVLVSGKCELWLGYGYGEASIGHGQE